MTKEPATPAPVRCTAAVLLCLATACAGSTPRVERRGAADEDLLALLPMGGEAVLDVEPVTLKGLPGIDRVLSELPASLRAAALDPLADLDAAAVSVQGLGSQQIEATLLLRGRLSFRGLTTWLRGLEPAAAEVDYHGVPVLESPAGRAAAMITPRTAAIGSRTAVRQVIDNARGDTAGLRGDAALMAALRKAPRAKSGRPAVMAALVPTQALRERLRAADLGELGADADYLALSLAAGDGIDVIAIAGFPQLPQARDVAARLKDRVAAVGARPALRLLGIGPYLEPLVIVAALAQPERRAPELHVAYRLSQEQLQGLIAKLTELGGLLKPRSLSAPPPSPEARP